MRDRGQVSLSLVEAGVGVIVILAVTAGFAIAPPAADERPARLDRHAGDVAATLQVASGDGSPPSIRTAVASADAFERYRPAVAERLAALVPASVLYRVETPRGTIGYPRPAGVTVGRAVVPTRHGDVVVEVWYV